MAAPARLRYAFEVRLWRSRLLVNQLPSFNAIRGAKLRDLAALKGYLQESFRPFDPLLDLWPVALDALLRFS